jgi:hypothetical protein
MYRNKRQKPEIKNLTRRIMSIKEKVKVLSSLDPYVQGVFAFPSAYVEAKWGSTGYVHCVKDEQIYDYIVENKKSNKLTKKEMVLSHFKWVNQLYYNPTCQ